MEILLNKELFEDNVNGKYEFQAVTFFCLCLVILRIFIFNSFFFI